MPTGSGRSARHRSGAAGARLARRRPAGRPASRTATSRRDRGGAARREQEGREPAQHGVGTAAATRRASSRRRRAARARCHPAAPSSMRPSGGERLPVRRGRDRGAPGCSEIALRGVGERGARAACRPARRRGRRPGATTRAASTASRVRKWLYSVALATPAAAATCAMVILVPLTSTARRGAGKQRGPGAVHRVAGAGARARLADRRGRGERAARAVVGRNSVSNSGSLIGRASSSGRDASTATLTSPRHPRRRPGGGRGGSANAVTDVTECDEAASGQAAAVGSART